MSDTNKPNLIVLPGGRPETVKLAELPNQLEFKCWQCGASCLLWPHTNPMAVQHALPGCPAWTEVEAQIVIGKKPIFTKDFLERCGVKLLQPVK